MRLDDVVGWAVPTVRAVCRGTACDAQQWITHPGRLLGSMLILFGTCLSISPAMAQLPELPPPTSPPPPAPATVPTPAPIPEEEAIPASTEEEPTPETMLEETSGFIRNQAACPQEFDVLSNLLVRDIPTYTNRILQSSVGDIPTAYRPAYVITANQPERIPLDITDRVYTTQSDGSQSLYQLFFTTLERQYSGLDATSIQHFHWLFLVPSEAGWDMVFMFSAIGDEETMLPPRDSSYGSIGQAVQRWLKDCKAEAIFVE